MSIKEDESQLAAVQALDIGQLRRAAKLLGITAEKTWTKEDYVSAIKSSQDSDDMVSAVFDGGKAPAPGYARVVIHRDQTPNHANGAVPVGVNGRMIFIPRGISCDVPIPFVEVLNNASEKVTQTSSQIAVTGQGSAYEEQSHLSYPFQVLAMTPGPFVNPNDGRSAEHAKREAFWKLYGNWPTDGELKEYQKAEMNNRMYQQNR